MRTLTLIILLTSAPLACLATKCMDDCTQFRIDVPPMPKSGYNAGKAVSAILDGLLTMVRAKTPFGEKWNAFGYIGGGLFSGIWGAAVDAREPAVMQEYQLAKGLQQTQDYLACVMEAQVSGAVYSLNERMDNDRINAFNSAIQGIVSYMNDNCAAHNCLNVSDVEPSKRNQAANAACMTPYPTVLGIWCSNVVWNPRNPVLCRGSDATGTIYEGICGEDNQCWYTDVGFGGTIKAYQALKTQFLAKDSIQNFNAFNDLRNPTAVVAYAKGALVYLSILQELHLLGSPTAEDGTARQFAQRAANWLQNRVEYHTNANVSLLTVIDANEANKYDQDPMMEIRKSCKSGDLYTKERLMACSKLPYGPFNWDTNFCVVSPNSIGTHSQFLCMGVCNTADQKVQAGLGSDGRTTLIRISDIHLSAAKQLAADNQRLFNSSGIFEIIASLREIGSKSMPDNSLAFYQQGFTPRFACNATQQLLRAGAPTVAPLGTWEEPDNLSKGSVVVRGVVIGGDKMKQVGMTSAPVGVPAKAKQPAAAPAKAKEPAAAPAKAKEPAAAPAKAMEPAGRRLVEQ